MTEFLRSVELPVEITHLSVEGQLHGHSLIINRRRPTMSIWTGRGHASPMRLGCWPSGRFRKQSSGHPRIL